MHIYIYVYNMTLIDLKLTLVSFLFDLSGIPWHWGVSLPWRGPGRSLCGDSETVAWCFKIPVVAGAFIPQRFASQTGLGRCCCWCLWTLIFFMLKICFFWLVNPWTLGNFGSGKGGFLKQIQVFLNNGGSTKRMIYNGKSYSNGWGTPILGNLHLGSQAGNDSLLCLMGPMPPTCINMH